MKRDLAAITLIGIIWFVLVIWNLIDGTLAQYSISILGLTATVFVGIVRYMLANKQGCSKCTCKPACSKCICKIN